LTPGRIAAAYEIDDLYDIGLQRPGPAIGVVAAATYHKKDLQIFWLSFGITRALPTRVQVMEPVVTRITETILDTQWASSMAPGADVIVYEGPDARNTALLFTFNEAIARGEVTVLTDSFAHREDSEPLPVRDQYDHSALMAAALGITVVSASGDSARPDTPCTSPYVTCVGGTDLETDDEGT
jgi:kumamolisin